MPDRNERMRKYRTNPETAERARAYGREQRKFSIKRNRLYIQKYLRDKVCARCGQPPNPDTRGGKREGALIFLAPPGTPRKDTVNYAVFGALSFARIDQAIARSERVCWSCLKMGNKHAQKKAA